MTRRVDTRPADTRRGDTLREDGDRLPAAIARDLDRGVPADPAAVDRVRETVMASFRARSADAAPTPIGPRPASRPVSPPRPWWSPLFRPAFAAGIAAVLAIGSVGLVAANSGPGDAFYGLRLAAEELNLPFAGGDSTNRTLDRLRQRLDEAKQDASDPAAVSAALKAYRDELERALAAATDEAARQRILAALGTHEVVLDTIEQNAPAAAGSGIQQARDQMGRAQQNLRSSLPSTPPETAAPTTVPDRTARPIETRRPSGR